MRYRLQRHDGTDCSATMVPITVLRMVPIQRYRQIYRSIVNYNNYKTNLLAELSIGWFKSTKRLLGKQNKKQ